MALPWAIRQLSAADWQVYRSVRLAMLVDSPTAYGSTYAREITFDEETWRERTRRPVYLAERSDGLPLGSATVLVLPERSPEIVAMWVAGHARGTDVAHRLVDACRERAVAEGHATVHLHVMLDNQRAVAFYTREGFTFDGEAGDVSGCARMSWSP